MGKELVLDGLKLEAIGLGSESEKIMVIDSTGLVKSLEASYLTSNFYTKTYINDNYLNLSGGTLTGTITSTGFIKSGGTASEFLKADGSVDTNSYALSGHTHDFDKYEGWNLRTDGTHRLKVLSAAQGGVVDLVGGTNVTISYGTGGVITFNSTDTNTQRTDEEIRDVIGTTLVGSGATSVTVDDVANTITINSTDTDTWRPIHDAPVNGATTTSISSNWAYDIVSTIDGKLSKTGPNERVIDWDVNGSIRIKRDSTLGWAHGYGFQTQDGVDRGGFNGYGGSASLSYYFIGLPSEYSDPPIKFTTTGAITASSFINKASDNNSVLLAGGGVKPLSDFEMEGDYLLRDGSLPMTGTLQVDQHIYGSAGLELEAANNVWIRIDKSDSGVLRYFDITTGSAETPLGRFANDGVFNWYGDVRAPKFINTSSSDSYILLGGGGTKAVSDFVRKDSFSWTGLTIDSPVYIGTVDVGGNGSSGGFKYNIVTQLGNGGSGIIQVSSVSGIATPYLKVISATTDNHQIVSARRTDDSTIIDFYLMPKTGKNYTPRVFTEAYGGYSIDTPPATTPTAWDYTFETNSIISQSFVKSGSSDSEILLGGGGTKALGDFVQTGNVDQLIAGKKDFTDVVGFRDYSGDVDSKAIAYYQKSANEFRIYPHIDGATSNSPMKLSVFYNGVYHPTYHTGNDTNLFFKDGSRAMTGDLITGGYKVLTGDSSQNLFLGNDAARIQVNGDSAVSRILSVSNHLYIGTYRNTDDIRLIAGDNQSTKLHISGSTGDSTFYGKIIKSGSSDSYMLLGGGGTKLVSDFATSGHNHDSLYVKKWENWNSNLTGYSSKRFRGFTVLPGGYVEGDSLNFRFDESQTAYIGDEGGIITFTGGSSPSQEALKKLFTFTSNYINLNSYKDVNNSVVIELSNISLSNSANTNWKPYTFFHAGGSSVTGLKVELKNGADTWEIAYDGTCSDFVIDDNFFTVSTGVLKGARWTFTGITNNSYLRMIGVIGKTVAPYQWSLLKSGGSMYGDVDWKVGVVKVGGNSVYHTGNDSNLFFKDGSRAMTGALEVDGSGGIKTTVNEHLRFFASGTGHYYFGNAGEGGRIFHYSENNDGYYGSYTFSGSTYNISTNGTLINFGNNITAQEIRKNGSSDSYMLLGGGGTKAISDFVAKTGDTMTGVLDINAPSLKLGSGTAGNTHMGYISLRDDADAEKAWIGLGSSNNSDLSIYNSYAGAFRVYTAGSERFTISSTGDATFSGKIIKSGSNDGYILLGGGGTYKLGSTSGDYKSFVPIVGSDQVMEVGKYIDFHTSTTGTTDYDVRLTALTDRLTSSKNLYVNSDVVYHTGNDSNLFFKDGSRAMTGNLELDYSSLADTSSDWVIKTQTNGSNFSGIWASNGDLTYILRNKAGGIGVHLKPGDTSTFSNSVSANSFINKNSSDSYMLLGGGGTKLVSDFATSGHNHDDRYYTESESDGRFEVKDHKYHEFSGGQYFYDSYSQGRYFRLFTENATYDQLRFQPISNIEYWDFNATTPAWTTWTGGESTIQTLLDGREDTSVNIGHTQRHFRFEVTRNSPWSLTAILVLQSTWSDISTPDITVEVETFDGTNWNLKETSVFNDANGITHYGTMARINTSLHDGDSQTRITVKIDNWTDTATRNTIPLKRLMLLNNYSGKALEPWTWDYNKVVDFQATPTVNSNDIYHTGNDSNLFYVDGSRAMSGILTLDSDEIRFKATLNPNKIRLYGSQDAHVIGTESYHNTYGASSGYANSIGNKFYRGGGELIAQIGHGGSGTPSNRLDSTFYGKIIKNGSSDSEILLGGGGTTPLDNLVQGTNSNRSGYITDDTRSISQSGIYRIQGVLNTPPSYSTYGYIFHAQHANSGDYYGQIYLDEGGDVMAFAGRAGATYSDWKKVWHTGNVDPVTIDTTQTITGLKTFSNELRVTREGLAATFGIATNSPNTAIANQTNYIQITGNSATDSMGLIFHNSGISTSALEYVNTDSSNGYFNFKSDDTGWNVRVNGNEVWHGGNHRSDSENDTTYLGINAKAADSDKLDGKDSSDFMYLHRAVGDITSIDDINQTYILAKDDSSYPLGTLPPGANNAVGIISMHTHSGNYSTQLALSTNTNDLFIRSDDATGAFGSWEELAKVSALSSSTQRTNWDTAYSWGNHANAGYITTVSPSAPTSPTASIVGETIEVTFNESTTTGLDNYLVYSSVAGSSYGLVAVIPPEDFALTMSVIDATFNVSGTISYRIYAVKNGVYSSPATVSTTFTASALEPANMEVIPTNTTFVVQWNAPNSRFVNQYNVYKHADATLANLARASATLVYSGNNTSYTYNITSTEDDMYHQFWVEIATT